MHEGYIWQSNYCAGLRVLDASKMEEGTLTEVAYFDVAPECDTPVFTGAWSVYPYFKSGNVIVQSIEKGLFVVKVSGICEMKCSLHMLNTFVNDSAKALSEYNDFEEFSRYFTALSTKCVELYSLA